jgi:hypothetical protein
LDFQLAHPLGQPGGCCFKQQSPNLSQLAGR